MKQTKLFLIAGIAALSLFAACSEDEEMTPAPATPTIYEELGGTASKTDNAKDFAGTQRTGTIETGRYTLRSVVDSAILIVAADTQMTKYFPVLFSELGAGNATGLTALSENFTDFMCVATGSKNANYAYTGKSMKDAHDPAKNTRMGLKSNAADFGAFAGDVVKSLAKHGVTEQTNKPLYDKLVALVLSTQGDIVQR